ncbi:nitroreductase family protein, partial [Gammaproteobacteria bacterium]|nr:nitroreductase family protein [Gammaproteobacteria bacterium]
MKVSDAVLSRKSIRAFTDVPVSNKVIEELLTTSARSASGGNLQPWKIYVINGPSMKTFLDFQSTWFEPES